MSAVNSLTREIVEIRSAKSSNDPHRFPPYRGRKIRIAEADGMLAERRDTVVAPFTGPLVHLFPRLDAWAVEQRETLRAEIKTLVGL